MYQSDFTFLLNNDFQRIFLCLHDCLVQFSADNVEHNLIILDGSGTFHGMGIIASITPRVEFDEIIPRAEVTNEEIYRGWTDRY